MRFVIMNGRHRPFGRHDGGLRQRRVGAAVALWARSPGCSAASAPGLAVGVVNGFMVVRHEDPAVHRHAVGHADGERDRAAAGAQPVGFGVLRHGFHLARPGRLARLSRARRGSRARAYVYGSVVLNFTSFGRHVLAIGGNEEASRLMGLPVDRVMFWAYVQSGVCAGLAGVILAAQFGAGQPAEGVGWELFSIAAVVVGGTLLTGGVGSVGDDAGRRAAARADLQRAQFRERARLDQPQRLLAIGGARRVPDGRGDGGIGGEEGAEGGVAGASSRPHCEELGRRDHA